MPIWLSGASSTAAAVDIKYPPSLAAEPEHDLSYWLDYYKDVYRSQGEIRRAAEAARDKAERDRQATEAARLRSEWATTPGRLLSRAVAPEEIGELVARLREEAAWIDGRVEVGPDDPAGKVIEVAFPAEARPELIRGTILLALGEIGAGELDRLWSGVERHWARIQAKGGEITERRVQLFIPSGDHDFDQRYRAFVPAGQAREVVEARAALDRAVEQAKSGRDRERLEEVRELIRGARALQEVEEAQQAAQAAEERERAEREREQAAEERARAAEAALARAAEEAERARAETRRVEEQRRAEVAELERRLARAEGERAAAERRADAEARERALIEDTMRKLQEALGLPKPGAPRELVPVKRRRELVPSAKRKGKKRQVRGESARKKPARKMGRPARKKKR